MRAPWPLAWMALCLGAGCHEDAPEPEPPTLEQASEKVNFGSGVSLGPHRSEVSVVRRIRRGDEIVSQADQQEILVWQDWDNFQYRRLQGGTSTTDHLVVGGLAWTRDPNGMPARVGDAEPFRLELRLAWDAWNEVLGPFSGRIDMLPGADGVIEGRVARPYTLSLRPHVPGGGRPSVELLELAGTVWLDAATAVRLLADVQGTWRSWGDEKRVHEIALHVAVSRIGEPQDLQAPRRRKKQGPDDG